ncbi:hypothetical protein AB0B45_14440 [Nonomuraea sp. NPDC049152]|uniref:hypothetical protein n=1 Tax=Nonomuraea sp. NPDC049152 TaxID=3154350 RepID=UPI00340D9DF6
MLAAQVGLILVGVLHYFPSKENLLSSVLQQRDDIDIPWFEEKWAEVGSFRGAMRTWASLIPFALDRSREVGLVSVASKRGTGAVSCRRRGSC